MRVVVGMTRMGDLRGRPADDSARAALVADMTKNGADARAYEAWPLFVQGYHNAAVAFYDLDTGQDFEELEWGPVEADVDPDTFRSLCGYADAGSGGWGP